jgi:perosamine synthetase
MEVKTKNKNLPYGHQWIDRNDIKAMVDVLKSGWITQGPMVDKFEKALAEYCNSKYAIVVSSGTSALHLAYLVAGVGVQDEIITSPLTFAATATTAVYCKAKPVFADIQEDTLNIDPHEIEKKITKKTKAIVPVDFAGQPCDYSEIKKIAQKHKLLTIEDASHSLGSLYKNKRVGSLADMTILSFHPVKTITTGEGGAILTNNKDFYEKLKTLRHHGIVKNPKKGKWYYEVEKIGYNYRLTDFQCALGISQLKKLNKFIQRRREIVKIYNKAFKDMKEIKLLVERKYVKSAWHIYPIQLNLEKLKSNRKKIFEKLQKQGIGVQVHYLPLNLHSFYKKEFGYKQGDFPKAENYYKRAITLPLFPKMNTQDIKRVIQTAKKIMYLYKK